jgi:Tfp pilus assembly protein PilN
MINLLPENQKNNIDREYTFRRLAVWLSGVLLLVAITLILMIPAYILSVNKNSAAKLNETQANTTSTTTAEIAFKKQLDDAKVLVRILRPADAQPLLLTHVMPILLKDKTGENSITDISYTNNGSGNATISIKGIAKTRESLSHFTDALAHEPGIVKVDVPVSNFAKESNIVFSFVVTAQK